MSTPSVVSVYTRALDLYEQQVQIITQDIDNFKSLVNAYSRALERAEEKLIILRQLIALEKLENESDTRQVPLSLNGLADASIPVVAERSTETVDLKILAREWYSFVEDRLYECGPTTVDALFAESPREWRDCFERVPSTSSALFRARRLLRRSSIFEVDRSTGMVTMTGSAVPAYPPFRPEDLIVVGVRYEDENKRTLIIRLRDADGEVDYMVFKGHLTNGLRAWMYDQNQALVPLAVKRMMNKRSQISSYDEEDWTNLWTEFIGRPVQRAS